MEINELKALFKPNSNIANLKTAIVDVRTYDEHLQISIPQTLHIPLDELPRRIEELKPFQIVYFFCRSGIRSQTAAELAKSMGINASAITNSVFEIAEVVQP